MGLLASGDKLLAGRCDGFAHASRRSAAWDVMNCENVRELHEIEEINSEMRIDMFQLFEREGLEFTRFVERDTHSFPDLLMSNTEWHVFADQVRGRRERIHVAGFGAFLHTLEIELDAFHPASQQRKQ